MSLDSTPVVVRFDSLPCAVQTPGKANGNGALCVFLCHSLGRPATARTITGTKVLEATYQNPFSGLVFRFWAAQHEVSVILQWISQLKFEEDFRLIS